MVLTMIPVMGTQAKAPEKVIKLDKDITLTEPVMVEKLGKNVVLDLNGHKIEGDFNCEGLCIVDNGAGLTIKDSSPSGTGKIISKGAEADSLACVKKGNLTINGGTFEIEEMEDSKPDALWLQGGMGGKLTINGGYIKSEHGAIYASEGSTLVINGGIIESHTKLVYLDGVVKAIINGGKLISQTSDAIFSANSVLDINGGDIAGSNALFLFGHGHSKVTIKGGNLTETNGDCIKVFDKEPYLKLVAERFEAPVGAKAITVASDKYHFKKATDTIAPGSVMELKQEAKLSAGSYTYNGKVKKPGVVVKNGNRVLKSGRDYTVSYAKGRKNVGAYKVTVTGKGYYFGKVNLSFKINPKGMKIKKLYRGFKKFYVKWKKQRTQTSGYQIIYSRSKKFSKAKVKTVRSNRYTGTNIKKHEEDLSMKREYTLFKEKQAVG
mgnify:FL=1